jgi:hypothetical protein
MSVIKEEKTEVKVEQSGHESGAKATVSKDGQTGKAEGKDAAAAIDKAKQDTKSTGGR